MPGADGCKDSIRGNRSLRIGFKRIVCGDYFLTQPSLHSCVPLFQRAQTGPNDLAG